MTLTSPTSESVAVHNRFLALEDEFDLFDITVDNVPIWERVRFKVNRRLMQKMGLIGTADDSESSHRSNQYDRLKTGASAITKKNPFVVPEVDVLVWGSPRRKHRDDGFWWDIYCDHIYDRVVFDYLHIEEPYFGTHKTPAKTSRIAYLDLVTIAEKVGDMVSRPNIQLDSIAHQTLSSLERSLESVFDVSLDVTGLVERMLRRRAVRKPLYEQLLHRLNPSVVLMIQSYGKETFIEVCKENGVRTVELQHGALSKYHFGYHYPGKRTKTTFPEYFYAFGDHFSSLASFPIPSKNIVSIGYPHLETALAKYTDKGANKQTSSDDRVLFLSQGTIGRELAKVAVSMNEAQAFTGEIVYKLHPEEYHDWADRYPELIDTDISVIEGDSPSLYELFASATAQVGVYSTTLYEGLAFGLSTYLLHTDRVEFVWDLVEAEWATVVDSADDLIHALSSQRAATVDRPELFEPNPWENLVTHLGQITDCDIRLSTAYS